MGRGSEHPLVARLVAEGLAEERRWQDAAALLHSATLTSPDDADVLTDFGRMLVRLSRPKEAMAAFDKAFAIAPDSYAAHLGAGSACMNLNDVAAARDHYGRAAEIEPHAGEPLSALAVIAIREGEPAGARALAEQALSVRPDLVRAQTVIAQAEMMEGFPTAAEARLKLVLGRGDLDDEQRADALGFLADALDLGDRPSEAFGIYSARNSILQRLHARAMQSTVSERRIDEARRLAAWFETAPSTPWRKPAGQQHGKRAPSIAGHVFLTGFPRSGTTLLETVLASHPSVVAMEESPVLTLVGGPFLADEDGLRRLEALDAAEADTCRERYWEGVEALFPAGLAGRVLVDKLALHTPELPVIAKLFPDAKVLFARRDPRDVVLSCFRRQFRMNAATYEFLTLEGAAAYYAQTMRLAEIYRSKLTLDIHDLRNEDIVADFEGEVRKTLRFIGLDWDPAIRSFPARARALSMTPSAPQVARGINAEGVGQWRRYRRQMAPVLAVLEPWVAQFGYEASAPDDLPVAPDAHLAARLVEINGATRAGDWTRAFARVDAAFAQGMDAPLLRRLRGVREQREGRLDAAIADFEAALVDAPGDNAILSALGLCLARAGRYAEALARLDTAVAIDPKFAPAHYNRGWTLEAMGELVAARNVYKRTVEIDPRHAQALGGLAGLAARQGDWAGACGWAQEALGLDPDQPASIIALARAESMQGDPVLAKDRLRRLIDDPGRATQHERAVAEGALGDVLDQLDRPSEAFAAYEAAGRRLKAIYGPRYGGKGAETSLTLAHRLAETFISADPGRWRRSPSGADVGETRGHVFLLGFPRSGTTMLGQALAGHADAITLDERDPLGDIARYFLQRISNISSLATAPDSDLEGHRALYWRKVHALGDPVAGKVVIDKAPMNTLILPIIARLFPDAKILFLRRDPRDVVFSALRRQFVINPTTIGLMTLGDAADLYDAVMALMEIYRTKLDLDLRVQGYEALVNDFEQEIRAVLEFAGLEWRPGLSAFEARAAAVATPSADQLASGLNTEGVGQWRRYRKEMAPVLARLEPWVERFGYPAT